MIKIDKKECMVSISGEANDLLIEMTTIIHTLYERFLDVVDDEEVVRDLFDHCYDMAFIRDADIKKAVDDDLWERIMGEDDEL